MTPERQKQIEREEKKISQSKARIQRNKAQENAEERKRKTRQQIIIGGLVIERARKHPGWHRQLMKLIDQLDRPQDKKAFQGFDLPAPPQEPEK